MKIQQLIINGLHSQRKTFQFLSDGNDFESIQKLQNEIHALSSEQAQMKKYKLALQDQVRKYAMLSTEERNEKKGRIEKYESLQKTLHQEQQNLLRA